MQFFLFIFSVLFFYQLIIGLLAYDIVCNFNLLSPSWLNSKIFVNPTVVLFVNSVIATFSLSLFFAEPLAFFFCSVLLKNMQLCE